MKLPRMPWQREDDGAAVEPEEGDMGRGYTGEEWDDTQDEETGGAEPEPEDELAELDDDTRALVEARVAKATAAATAAQQAQFREAFQAHGFDLNADGRPLVADPQRVREFALGVQPAAAPAAAPAAPPVEDDPEPDMYSEPDQWKAWNRKQARKEAAEVFEERFAQFAPRLEQQEQFQMSVAEERDVARVMDLLPDTPGSDVRQMGAREHRAKFQQSFLRHYRGVPPAQRARLSDDDLETLAFAAARDVLPRGEKQRDDRGRYASPQSVNARLYGDSWQAHPDGSRAPARRAEASPEERRVMEEFKMSEKEYVALAGQTVTLADYRAAQAREKGKK
jgi:hypothetical protein